MKDCWMSPYGEVLYCSGIWNHNSDAEKILIERYGFKDALDIDDKYPDLLASEVLEEIYGWCRYTTCANRGWMWLKKLTTDQKNKIYDLTGEIIVDPLED